MQAGSPSARAIPARPHRRAQAAPLRCSAPNTLQRCRAGRSARATPARRPSRRVRPSTPRAVELRRQAATFSGALKNEAAPTATRSRFAEHARPSRRRSHSFPGGGLGRVATETTASVARPSTTKPGTRTARRYSRHTGSQRREHLVEPLRVRELRNSEPEAQHDCRMSSLDECGHRTRPPKDAAYSQGAAPIKRQ